MSVPKNELPALGFISAGWRRGLVTFFLALQSLAIIWLYIDKNNAEHNNKLYIEKLNERLLDQVLPTVKKMDQVANKVDTVAKQTGEAASRVDSISSMMINQNK